MLVGRIVLLMVGLLCLTQTPCLVHASTSMAIPIPSRTDAVCHGLNVGSYEEALSAVVCKLAREFDLLVYAGHLVLHRDRQSFESSLIAGVRFDPSYARQTASWALAVTMPDRILVNEPALATVPWLQRMSVLAHELTHAAQYGLASGRRSTSEQWLREGLAEWVSARVTDSIDPGSFAHRLSLAVGRIRKANRHELPALSQLVTFREFAEHRSRQGSSAVYDLAFLAADLLIEEAGLPAVIEYFRLFSQSDDRVQNFRAAFRQDPSDLERRFSSRLEKLVR